ncbi:MAG: hypothetical protein II966_07520 [Lachnospiraceae bacterium]|nr:hypothetical protein [Lachnospiraceae bacterium]
MKKVIYAIAAVLIMLTAALIALILYYASNPDFAAKVNSMRDSLGISENRAEKSTEEATEKPEEPELFTDDDEDPLKAGVREDLTPEYDAPLQHLLEVPDDKKERTGFEEITDKIETVPDERADRIENELSTGPTGDDLTFDPLYYPYYEMLDDKSQHLYRQIYANAMELNGSFKSVEKEITRKQLFNAFTAVFYDHPELFWINTSYGAIYRKNGDFLELDMSFNQTAGDIEASKEEFNNITDSIISEAMEEGSDYDKEKLVHDRLSEMNRYNFGPLNQSAYSALLLGKTVCAGYSRAFSHIMTSLGIPCYYCVGYAGEAHGWNIICLEDDFYNVDVTWDDTDDGKVCNYDWFNRTDRDYATTHRRKELSVYLPPCNGEKYKGPEPEEEEDVKEEEPYEEPAEEEEAQPLQADENLPGLDQGRPTLSSYGLTEDDVINNVQDYYDDCARRIREQGKGSYKLYNAVSPEVMDELYKAYNAGTIRSSILTPVAEELDAGSATIRMQPVLLADGSYLIENSVAIR